MTVIAIDPGRSGGIAVKWPRGDVEAFRMPETVHDMAALFRELSGLPDDECRAVLENVHSMPHDGTSSAFAFGRNFGQIEGILAALAIPYELVAPTGWMKRVGSLPKVKAERKRALKAFAQRTYPNLKITLMTADALALLAVTTKEQA